MVCGLRTSSVIRCEARLAYIRKFMKRDGHGQGVRIVEDTLLYLAAAFCD